MAPSKTWNNPKIKLDNVYGQGSRNKKRLPLSL